MNKKGVIFLLVAAIAVVASIIGITFYLSYKTVHVVFKEDNLAVSVYSDNDDKMADISSTSDITLREGNYYYTPTTDGFSSDKVYFTVKNNDTTVEISPAYSSTRLSDLLEKNKEAIHAALAIYPLLSNYVIADESLYYYGEWYSAHLVQRVSGTREPDVYRVILKKDDDTWKIAVSPRITISINDFPSIPDYVIRQVNKAPSTQALDSSRAS